MGTVVGSDGAANEIGMAPDAKWIACRNMDAGFGSPSSYIDCYQFFLAPTKIGGDAFKDGRPELAPHVINNSWGCPAEEGCDKDEMVPVLQAIKAAGIFNVVSAGNDGPSCSTINVQPATITEGAFVVGSYNHRNGKVSGFSSRGPSLLTGLIGPDIMAPGEQIFSSVPGNLFQDRVNVFQPWSGTSMAGPHVAGAVALLWAAVPSLVGKIDETAKLLQQTATALPVSESCGGVAGSAIPNNTSGYGILNIAKAVDTASAK
jgi:subtilisin family serine protease